MIGRLVLSMKIFISWSKEPSKQIAEALAEWLPDVIQSLKPWVSREIPAGSRWNTEIANELSSTKFGIICVTSASSTGQIGIRSVAQL
jgi:hypothetical protein